MQKRDAYVEKIKLELDELNAKMGKLEAKAKETKKDARDTYKREIDRLHQQSQLAIAKLDELKAARKDSWESMVSEMERIRDAFNHSFHYFTSQL